MFPIDMHCRLAHKRTIDLFCKIALDGNNYNIIYVSI